MSTDNTPVGAITTTEGTPSNPALPDTVKAHLAADHAVAEIQESWVEYSMGFDPDGYLSYEIERIEPAGYAENDFVCRTCELVLEPPAFDE